MAIDYFAQQFDEDVFEDTAAVAPDYKQIVLDAYGTIGRTGVGEDVSQVDQAGLDYWINTLQSGASTPEAFNRNFQTAVTDYIATKPDDKYTQYVNNYLGNTTADTSTGGITNLITTGATTDATDTSGIATLVGSETGATGAATTGNVTGATTGATTTGLNNNNVVALGDSTTYGYNAGNQLDTNMVTSAQNTLGSGYTINNLGVNSTTVGDLLSGANNTGNNWANTLASDAGIVVLNYGLNEASRGESPETFKANLLNAVNQAKAAGKQVVLQTPNAVGSDIGWGKSVSSYADVIRDVAKSTGSALDDKFAYTSGRDDIFDTTTGDTLHPGSSMYTTLGVNLANTIAGLKPATGATTATADTTAAPDYTAIKNLYETELNREGEQAGIDYWYKKFGNEIDANELAEFKTAAQAEINAKNATTATTADAAQTQPAAFDLSKSLNLSNGTYLTPTGAIVDAEGNTVKDTGSAATSTLTNQILSQGLTSKWSGEGKGSTQANAADMASILTSIGITDIKDFGVVPVYSDVQEIGKTYNGQRVFTSTDENTGQPFSYRSIRSRW